MRTGCTKAPVTDLILFCCRNRRGGDPSQQSAHHLAAEPAVGVRALLAIGCPYRTSDNGYVQLAIADQRDRFRRSTVYDRLLDYRIASAVSKKRSGCGGRCGCAIRHRAKYFRPCARHDPVAQCRPQLGYELTSCFGWPDTLMAPPEHRDLSYLFQCLNAGAGARLVNSRGHSQHGKNRNLCGSLSLYREIRRCHSFPTKNDIAQLLFSMRFSTGSC
ncbi:hypothetical protein QE435_004904 [Rhizobium sp. SORGH_AS 787]|nr:hypothetical protein [Rhizobium sp. SORGH_AS_0787]